MSFSTGCCSINHYLSTPRPLLICGRNYEQIVEAHQNNPQRGEEQVSDQVKFRIFQSIMDSLFQTFSSSVSVNSFQELSACVFGWIEEHCKPQASTTGSIKACLGAGDPGHLLVLLI